MLAIMFLTACGGGSEKNTGSTDSNRPTRETSTDKAPGGEELFSNYRCFACHSLEGRVMYGPSLNGLYGKEISVIRQGEEITVLVDREYFTRAIEDPDYEKVLEYRNRIMTKPDISDEEIDSIVDYLVGLGEEE
jgi:cytochrome c oxidase subunit 2